MSRAAGTVTLRFVARCHLGVALYSGLRDKAVFRLTGFMARKRTFNAASPGGSTDSQIATVGDLEHMKSW